MEITNILHLKNILYSIYRFYSYIYGSYILFIYTVYVNLYILFEYFVHIYLLNLNNKAISKFFSRNSDIFSRKLSYNNESSIEQPINVNPREPKMILIYFNNNGCYIVIIRSNRFRPIYRPETRYIKIHGF